MKRALVLVLLCAGLGGCLEVEQYPRYVDQAYAGKPDELPSQVHFHGDRLAWNAAVIDRNHHQNEYERTRPPSREGHPEHDPR